LKRTLIVFAREPEVGFIKTRLTGHLAPEKIVRLYCAFLKDTLQLARQVQCEERLVAYISQGEPRYLQEIADGFSLWPQEGADLGQRMSAAMSRCFHSGPEARPIIIGSDTPHLTPARIDEAFRVLEEDDMILGPSADGGFYLIGMRVEMDDIFKDVVWSSKTVFRQTMKNAQELGRRVKLLPNSYDIDLPQDVQRLKEDLLEQPDVAPATRKELIG